MLVTRDLTANILAGVTRRACSPRWRSAGINAIEERAFTRRGSACGAREAFITSATGGVIPVVRIDGQHDRRRASPGR